MPSRRIGAENVESSRLKRAIAIEAELHLKL